ncbi:Hypothetical predicted protein [Podarcis lilfordi]|uniref:Uncharacterized protein n=1 Tax=Podarcis lilfordi TaxID=74358 RepID=A0AA35PDY9_9SAUR|nr:Hypothetical predicted protein [Podarcis lilfordi]
MEPGGKGCNSWASVHWDTLLIQHGSQPLAETLRPMTDRGQTESSSAGPSGMWQGMLGEPSRSMQGSGSDWQNVLCQDREMQVLGLGCLQTVLRTRIRCFFPSYSSRPVCTHAMCVRKQFDRHKASKLNGDVFHQSCCFCQELSASSFNPPQHSMNAHFHDCLFGAPLTFF